MPLKEEPHNTRTATLGALYTIEYDLTNGWGALLTTNGPRLNFSPETMSRFRQLFADLATSGQDAASAHVNGYHLAYEDGFLEIRYRERGMEFSYQATQSFRAFLAALPRETLHAGEEEDPHA